MVGSNREGGLPFIGCNYVLRQRVLFLTPFDLISIFYTQTVPNASFIYSKSFYDLATISLQACQQITALLKQFPGLFTLKSLAQVKLRDDRITSCGYLRFAFTFSTSSGFLRVGF